jgi:beta-phosphoglucomutase
MITTSTIQAVIFDLDGVITDTAEHHYLAWKAIADELHIRFTRAFNENLKGVSRMDSLKLLLSQADTPVQFTDKEMEELADRKNKLYQSLIESITPADILPGVAEFTAELQRRGIKTAIASASKNAFTVMNSLKLTNAFDIIVDAAKIKNTKPDPEVFSTAAELLGVEPNHCVGVEDAAAGVQAIKAAGMFAVAIGAKEAFPQADLVLSNTSELDCAKIEGLFIANS